MQRLISLVAFVSLLAAYSAVAQKYALPNPLVVDGETFVNPVYNSHDASRLNITHETGIASLSIVRLPDAVRDKLGYNSNTARLAEEALKKSQENAMAQQQLERQKLIEREQEAERTKAEVAKKSTAVVAQSKTESSISGNSTTAKKQKVLPDQPWVAPMASSSARLGFFQRGLLPLKESEARDLFSDREISPLSSRCALDAVKAAKVMLGLLGPEYLPRDYRKIARRSDPPSARASAAATARRSTSVPFDPSIFPVGTAPASVPSGSLAFTAGPAPIHAHPVAAADGDPHVHRMWHGADGSSATQQGNALFHSDGRISHGAFPAGGQFNTFHSSDGSVHHQSGNAMFPAGGGAGMFGAP